MRTQKPFCTKIAVALICALALTFGASQIVAQAPARFIGTITTTGSNQLTLKTDAGQSYDVQVPTGVDIKRIAPGERDLSKAETIPFSDLAVGDRALVKLDPNSAAGILQALQIIAIKKTDVVQRQEQEREAWQRHGVGGLVKSVEATTGTIVLTSGTGPTLKTVTVHTTANTVLKRYAEGSIRFADAKPAPLSQIQPGDQLRARGQKNPAGTEIEADEVVSGTFRNISGVVSSIDTSAGTFQLKDLLTKKNVTVHIPHTAQMRRLPDRMAKMLAAALKDGAHENGAQAGSAQGFRPPTGVASPSAERMHAQGHNGDMQQILSSAPSIDITGLRKGDAVMLVSTQGSEDVTAITLLAGVEPLLEAPSSESQNLLSNWSMSTSGGDTGAQ